jgi:hypothetical protein
VQKGTAAIVRADYRGIMKYSLISLPFVFAVLAACGLESNAAVASQTKAATAQASAPSAGDAHLGAPKRRNGWWEFTAATGSSRQNMCVAEATEAVFSAFDQITQAPLLGYACSKTDFHKSGGGWAFDVACDTGIPAAIGGGVVTSKGTISGDISTRYEVQMSVAQAGETRNGTVKAEWKGACPAGRKAGDLVTGTTVVNVLE